MANARNIAVNSPIQGSAADLIKLAMLKIQTKIDIEGLSSTMLLQVHDELVFEVPDNERLMFTNLVKSAMEGAMDLSVPLVTSIGCGEDWLEAHG